MSKPLVALVGRPNVGKSTLFNRMVGSRISIVDDEPGVTRDRVLAETRWQNSAFTLIDTGGIDFDPEGELLPEMRTQAEIAIAMADVIVFLVDAKQGVTSSDEEIAMLLHRSGKPILVAVNKCDNDTIMRNTFYDFYQLGLAELFAISAEHKLGFGELLDAVVAKFERDSTPDGEAERPINIAIIGRPNAGKSSLANRIIGENRAIVSPIAGTTRDAIDMEVTVAEGKFCLIDTAGLRRKSKIDNRIERYAVLRTLAAISRSDVCLVMVDAEKGVTEQDTKVAGHAHQAGKSIIIVVNKWDLIEKETGTLEAMEKQIKARFAFMAYAPVIFISALTGQRVHNLLGKCRELYLEAGKRLATGVLNEVIASAVAMNPTPQDKGRHLKIYYGTQVAVHPPQFVLFVNDRELTHFSYDRYLENQLRLAFGFAGTCLRLLWRGKADNQELQPRSRTDRKSKTKSGNNGRKHD